MKTVSQIVDEIELKIYFFSRIKDMKSALTVDILADLLEWIKDEKEN